MSDTYKIRRLGGDKIALLGLFVLSLLTARLVVGLKSVLVLSGPIPLRDTGLSASVPVGNGWQSRRAWAPEGNSYMLSSTFSAGTGQTTAGVICRYREALTTTSLLTLFEQKAEEFGGYVAETGQTTTGALIFDWARVKGEQTLSTAFLGTASLPDNWQLDIEVYEITGDTRQAEEAFKRVIESVNLEYGRTTLGRT